MNLLAYLRNKAKAVLGDRTPPLESSHLARITRSLINSDAIIFEADDYALVIPSSDTDSIAFSPRTNGFAVVTSEGYVPLPDYTELPDHPFEVKCPGETRWSPVMDYDEAAQHCISVAKNASDGLEWEAILRHSVEHVPVARIDGTGVVRDVTSGDVVFGPAGSLHTPRGP